VVVKVPDEVRNNIESGEVKRQAHILSVRGDTRVLGVFGCPVEHSVSPAMQNTAIQALGLNYVYVPFHVLPEMLGGAIQGLRALEVAGVNITIPHKRAVIPFLDSVSERARLVGSVNTVTNVDGVLTGDTTDGPGFLQSVEAEWGVVDGTRALILGAGGSAKAIAFALVEAGCLVSLSNRTRSKADELAEAICRAFGEGSAAVVENVDDALREVLSGCDMLINTTSVGMRPKPDEIPVNPELLRSSLMVCDIVYNPLKTRLLAEAERCGARTLSGIKMLARQGAISLEKWTGCKAPVDIMERAALAALGSSGEVHGNS